MRELDLTVSGPGGGRDQEQGAQHGSQLSVTRAPGLCEQEATQPAHNSVSSLASHKRAVPSGQIPWIAARTSSLLNSSRARHEMAAAVHV